MARMAGAASPPGCTCWWQVALSIMAGSRAPSSGCHLGGEPPGDRPGARADVQAPPAGGDRQRTQDLDGVFTVRSGMPTRSSDTGTADCAAGVPHDHGVTHRDLPASGRGCFAAVMIAPIAAFVG